MPVHLLAVPSLPGQNYPGIDPASFSEMDKEKVSNKRGGWAPKPRFCYLQRALVSQMRYHHVPSSAQIVVSLANGLILLYVARDLVSTIRSISRLLTSAFSISTPPTGYSKYAAEISKSRQRGGALGSCSWRYCILSFRRLWHAMLRRRAMNLFTSTSL